MVNDNIEKFGRTFKLVKMGMDQDEVFAFMEELINERDTLIKRQEHVASLTRLYEKTVADADELAKQIKEEAKEKAQTVANGIINEARNQADTVLAEKMSEAATLARQQVEAIKEKTKARAGALINEELEKYRLKISDCTARLCVNMNKETESLVNQANEIIKEFEQNITRTETAAETTDSAKENKTKNDKTAKIEAAVAPEKNNNGHETEETIEVEILPPRDLEAIAAINAYFTNLPEVLTAKLVESTDKSMFAVNLKKQVDLLEILRSLSQIYHAEEFMENKQRKILVTLKAKAKLENTQTLMKEKLTRIFAEGKQ